MKLWLRTQFLKMWSKTALHNITGTLLQVSKSWLLCTAVPVDIWDAAYAMPTNPKVLRVNTVTIDDSPQPYDIYERYIYINAGTNDDVVLNYIFRVDTQYWPPAFTLWVIYRMASVLALSVTRKKLMLLILTLLLLNSSIVEPKPETHSKSLHNHYVCPDTIDKIG